MPPRFALAMRIMDVPWIEIERAGGRAVSQQ